MKQVISTFINNPKLKDDRYGTIKTIFEAHYAPLIISGNTITIYKVMSDIDRCFRLVQQRIPSLRGETWSKRQKQGGRYTSMAIDKINRRIDKMATQLNLEF